MFILTIHCKRRLIMMPTLSSLATLHLVIVTNCSATEWRQSWGCDDNFAVICRREAWVMFITQPMIRMDMNYFRHFQVYFEGSYRCQNRLFYRLATNPDKLAIYNNKSPQLSNKTSYFFLLKGYSALHITLLYFFAAWPLQRGCDGFVINLSRLFVTQGENSRGIPAASPSTLVVW